MNRAVAKLREQMAKKKKKKKAEAEGVRNAGEAGGNVNRGGPNRDSCDGEPDHPPPGPELLHPAWDLGLHTPPRVVSDSERSQIESLLDGMADTILQSSADMSAALKLKKPLRPLWHTPQSIFFEDQMPDMSELPFTPIICLSASEAVDVQPRVGFTYLQGCADVRTRIQTL